MTETRRWRRALEEWIVAFEDYVAKWPTEAGRLYAEVHGITRVADEALAVVRCDVAVSGDGGQMEHGLMRVLPWVRLQLELDAKSVRGRIGAGIDDESIARDLIDTIERATEELG